MCIEERAYQLELDLRDPDQPLLPLFDEAASAECNPVTGRKVLERESARHIGEIIKQITAELNG
jgi:hypothetical protein